MLREHAITVNGKTRGFSVRINDEADTSVFHQVFGTLDYRLKGLSREHDVISLHRTLRAGKVRPLIIDAGANIGASVVFFACEWEGSTVVALEPHPGNCTLLRENCKNLDCTILQAGIASADGEMALCDPGRGSWGYRLQASGAKKVRVHGAATLAQVYCRDGRVPFIFKCDIEGGEAELFSQNTSWIDLFPVIIIELHDWMLPNLAVSKNFFRAISGRDFDVVHRGENLFCFNNRLL